MTILPQIELTSAQPIAPESLLDAAVRDYRAKVVKDGVQRVVAGPLEFEGSYLSAVLKEVMTGHMNPYRIMAGAAIRHLILDSRERNGIFIEETDAAQVADEAALNLVTYVASTSGDAVLDGYHRMVNMGIPPKEAARRAINAFGLTKPQMRTMIALKPDQGVKSSVPGSLKKKSDAYIQRAFQQRVRTLNQNTVRQVEHDAVQSGWEEEVRTGTLQDTTLKVWLTAADERTCPICAPMDRHAVGVMDTFRLPDGNRVKNPPVHVNCRCSAQLVRGYRDVERFSKAWDESKHPRQKNGEFGTKTELRTQTRLDSHPLRSSTLTDDAISTTDLSDIKLTNTKLSSTKLTDQRLSSLTLGGFSMAPTEAEARVRLTDYTLNGMVLADGKTYTLTNLSLAAKAAAVRDDQMVTTVPPLTQMPGVPMPPYRPMGEKYTCFALPQDMERTDLSDTRGAVDVRRLRFVRRDQPDLVRGLINEKMAEPRGADQYFREHEHDMDVSLDQLRTSRDPNVRMLYGNLTRQLIAPGKRAPKDPRIGITAQQASDAWREVFTRPRSAAERERQGWEDGKYSVTVFDGRWQVAEEIVPAQVITSLTNVSPDADFMPRVFAAHYTWDSTVAGTLGETERVNPYNDNELNVRGPFLWEKGPDDVIWLTPDEDLQSRMARGRAGEG